MSELPGTPWENISIDFCGPLPNGDYLFVIVDEY
jgi:rubredoxin